MLTVCGPVEPLVLGRVLMHEHLHSEAFDYGNDRLIEEEKPITPERRKFLMREDVPWKEVRPG